jgi:hypothetical protein
MTSKQRMSILFARCPSAVVAALKTLDDQISTDPNSKNQLTSLSLQVSNLKSETNQQTTHNDK